jgi:hypothetical protein
MTHYYCSYYKANILISLVGFAAILLFLAKDYWELSFSIAATIGFLIMLINKYLWKYKPFIWLFWIEDFSGRYEGFVEYEFKNKYGEIEQGKLKHIKIIHQTGSSIKVNSFTIKLDGSPSSVSGSISMCVSDMGDEKHFELIYSYLNNGDNHQYFPPHYGTEIIKIVKNGKDKFLSGRYFTERLPFQTRGKFIGLKKVSDNLEHIF